MSDALNPLDYKVWYDFQTLFLHQLDEFGLSHGAIDHVAYRVPSLARYAEVLAFLGEKGTRIGEARMGDRPISIFRLDKGLYCHGIHIELVELMAPKPGTTVEEGWDHVEYIVNEPLERFMAKFPNTNFNRRSLNKKLNPTISLALEGGISAKFHRVPLDEIIRLEHALCLSPGI